LQDYHRKNKVATGLSIVSNILLTAGKMVVGVVTMSTAVMAEAIHSAVDLVAAIIAFVAVRQAARPADKNHPYGHGKFDSLSGMIEGLLIFAAAGYIIFTAVRKLIYGGEVESAGLGFIIMMISAAINTGVSFVLFRTAKKTGSNAVEADAHHLSTDVITSIGVAAAMLAIHFTGWHVLDPIIALAVSVFILKAAFGITKKSISVLLDASLPEDEVRKVEDILKKRHPAIVGFHELRTRRSSVTRFVDLHLVSCRDMTVAQAHAIADNVESDIEVALPGAKVMIHLEPCGRDIADCNTGCSMVTLRDMFETTRYARTVAEDESSPQYIKDKMKDV
jgi:cation diffusion facilitator family transporter